jgi:hypothetical protein
VTRPSSRIHAMSSDSVFWDLVEVTAWELAVMILEALLDDTVMGVTSSEKCIVGRTADSLDKPYREAFLRIVDVNFTEGGLPSGVASKKLATAGIKIGETTIHRHRRGLCLCQKG